MMLRSIKTQVKLFGNCLNLLALKAELPVYWNLGEAAGSFEPSPFLLDSSYPERRVS
jgi:hypothetical protein